MAQLIHISLNTLQYISHTVHTKHTLVLNQSVLALPLLQETLMRRPINVLKPQLLIQYCLCLLQSTALASTSLLSSCKNLTSAILPGFSIFATVDGALRENSQTSWVHEAFSKPIERRGKLAVIALKPRLFLRVAEKLTF